MSEQESLHTSKASDNEGEFNALPQPTDAYKASPENSIICSTDESDTLIEMSGSESKEDQENPEKTSEDDSSEQANIKKSRELKSLLALSKEANLDTNISHKRKVVEGHKTPMLKNTSSESEIKIIKVATENKHNFKYPVTAESELEEEVTKNEPKISSDNTNKLKRKRDNLVYASVGGATEDSKKNRKTFSGELKMFKANKDAFCWRCHRSGVNVACETCPRSYHQKCLKQTINNPDHWPCPECVAILKAENTQTRSEAMKGLPLEYLCKLLKFAVNRMIQCQGSDPFLHPVNDIEFPEYKKYIIQPMELSMLLNNIKENFYGSTQAFEADAKWLLHNSIIFNSYQSKLTYAAKTIIKVCKQEMTEIENCPNCYMNANTKRTTWFVEVCPKPHLLVWAKLKGKQTAAYLNLPDTNLYFRMTSATVLVDAGGDITAFKRHGGWKSNSVEEGYIENSVQNKINIFNTILNSIETSNNEISVNITSRSRSVVSGINFSNCKINNLNIFKKSD